MFVCVVYVMCVMCVHVSRWYTICWLVPIDSTEQVTYVHCTTAPPRPLIRSDSNSNATHLHTILLLPPPFIFPLRPVQGQRSSRRDSNERTNLRGKRRRNPQNGSSALQDHRGCDECDRSGGGAEGDALYVCIGAYHTQLYSSTDLYTNPTVEC